MDEYNENVEQELNRLKKQKEENDRTYLRIEIILGIIITMMFIAMVVIASYVEIQDSIRLLIIVLSAIFVIIVSLAMLKIEQIAGYYECGKCHYKQVPTYIDVLKAPHMGRTRYLKCPKCNEKSWQRKVIS